jgi:hypothetical protein
MCTVFVPCGLQADQQVGAAIVIENLLHRQLKNPSEGEAGDLPLLSICVFVPCGLHADQQVGAATEIETYCTDNSRTQAGVRQGIFHF